VQWPTMEQSGVGQTASRTLKQEEVLKQEEATMVRKYQESSITATHFRCRMTSQRSAASIALVHDYKALEWLAGGVPRAAVDAPAVPCHEASSVPSEDDGGDMLTLHEEELDYTAGGPAGDSAFQQAVQVVRQQGTHRRPARCV